MTKKTFVPKHSKSDFSPFPEDITEGIEIPFVFVGGKQANLPNIEPFGNFLIKSGDDIIMQTSEGFRDLLAELDEEELVKDG